MSKYNSRKTVVQGITFDSKKESYRFLELQMMQRAVREEDRVVDIQLQPEFILIDKFEHQGKKYRGTKYRADFRVVYADGRIEVEDVKGFKTAVYKLKKKMLLSRYSNINFKEV